MMKTRLLIKDGEYILSRAGCMDAKIDAEELYCFLTGVDRVGLFLRAEEEVAEKTEEEYRSLISRRASRTPLQHITGVQEFMGYRFKVSADVLIPRQDTETLVSEAARIIQQRPQPKHGLFGRARRRKNWNVLDLCCGSGAIAISLSKICTDVRLIATDISDAAIELAEDNARSLRTKVEFYQGNMFRALDSKKLRNIRYDMIVSNPPYIRTNMIAMFQEEVKSHEPMVALDGGRDGLDFYRKITEEAPDYMTDEGWLIMEIGNDQGEELRKMLRDSGRYTPAEIIRDLAGRDRVVRCQKR